MQREWELGQQAAREGRWQDAAKAFRAVLARDRGFLPAWIELSTVCEKLDAYRDAHHAVIEASRITEVPPMAGLIVARKLRRFECLVELQDYVQHTRLDSRLPPERLLDLAGFFTSAGDHQRAEIWIEQVVRSRPDLAEAHNMLGLLRMFAGRTEEARSAFEQALRLRPGFASVYSVLSRLSGIHPGNTHIDALRRRLDDPTLATRDEAHLSFALHNELHDLGEFDAAWEALRRGCRARRSEQAYDHAATLAMFEQLRRTYPDASVLQVPGGDTQDNDAPIPIFIVGLHRSGTTLLERILSGHPDIADAGETYAFTARLRLATDRYCEGVADSTLISRLSGIDHAEVGRGFLASMQRRARGRRFITEKQNPNHILLGSIAAALPQAKILHLRRDAMDVCFSNLRMLFTLEAAYSYDQVEMADYFHAYHGLMAHWRDVMGERVFDVDYQALVDAPKAKAQAIAAHCGFEYHEGMMDLGRNEGMVATASSQQVRSGISPNRAGIWRHYEKHLAPLIDRLSSHDHM